MDSARRTVAIDPGHGGCNSGAVVSCGVDRFVEKLWNLKIARATALAMHGVPLDVELLRNDDEDRGLDDRGQEAMSLCADFVVSIHCNALPQSEKVHGMETYYLAGSSIGLCAAQAIVNDAPPSLYSGRMVSVGPDCNDQQRTRWKQRPLNVLQAYEGRSIPAVLVECLYLTNGHDREFAKSRWGIPMIAGSIRSGILNAMRAMDDRST